MYWAYRPQYTVHNTVSHTIFGVMLPAEFDTHPDPDTDTEIWKLRSGN